MPVLHLITHSPAHSDAFLRCLERLGEDDSIVLLQEGFKGLPAADQARCSAICQAKNARLYGLQPQPSAGHPSPSLGGVDENGFACVDYSGLVALTVEYRQILTWS